MTESFSAQLPDNRPAGPAPVTWLPAWLTNFFERSQCCLGVTCVFIYLLGVLVRALYIFYWHRPENYIYSDMDGYVRTAFAWFRPEHPFGPGDTLMPPGYQWFLGYLFHLDDKKILAVRVQFLMSAAVPPMLAATAYQLYGRPVALLSLVLAAIYYPFIDYAGYFLTEGTFLFAIVLTMLLLVSAIHARSGVVSLICAFLSGAMLAASALVKPGALMVAMLVFICLGLAVWRHRWRWLALIMGTSVVGLAVALLPMSVRTTRLYGQGYVLIATGGPNAFLQGHGGPDMGGISFRDPYTRQFWGWGSPAMAQKLYEYEEGQKAVGAPIDPTRFRKNMHFEFPPWDPRLAQAARQRIYEAPFEVLMQSCENVLETFFTTLPWPSCSLANTPWQTLILWSHRFFVWLILLPGVFHLLWRRRQLRENPGLELADALMALPVLGAAMIVFFVLPEARYRVPFDAFALVLAARFYTHGVARPDGLVPPAPAKTQGGAK